METVFFFKNMLPEDEEKLRDYFTKKLPKFENILGKNFSPDSVLMHVTGERFEKHSAYNVELTLKCPLATITAAEASHMITKAVDLAKDRLEMQLKKAMLHNRRTHRGIRAKSKIIRRSAVPQ